MKTIADFKRAAVLGSIWHSEHRYTGPGGENPIWKNLGTRAIGKIQSNSFAFKTDRGTLSWCDWPKKNQVSIIGRTVLITTSFCQLRYTLKSES